MRNINTSDVFKLARVMDGSGMSERLTDLYFSVQDTKDVNAEKIGLKAIMIMFECCANEKQESKIYDLIAGITEKDADSIASQSIDETIADLKAIAENNNIMDFFKKASQLTQ